MAVFFDLDGTLLDDDAAMRAGALAILAQHRAAFDLPDDAFARRWKDLAVKGLPENNVVNFMPF